MKYMNPIIPGFYPDPSVCRVDKDYFLVTSSFEYFPGVPIFHSRDLIRWQQIGHCLTRPTQLPLSGAKCSDGIYAPTIRHHKGRFYMVTTNTSHGGNFFVWTDDPYGEWSEPVWLDQGGIDPSLLFDEDGKVYLTTCLNQQSEIKIADGSRLSEIRQTWKGTGGAFMEAPHLYRFDDRYYLMVAEGGTGRGHTVCIARSYSPWGPFESCPHNPILSNRGCGMSPVQATGHGDLIQAHDGSWWMVFLAVRDYQDRHPFCHNLGRETFLAPVSWSDDGWPIVNGNGTVSLEMTANCLPAVPVPSEPNRDDFNTNRVHLSWNFLRNPNEEDYSFSKRAGWLALRASPVTLDVEESPAFLGRRQQHVNCKAITLVDFEPSDTDEAGLTVFMNNRHHYDIALRRENGKRHVFVRRRIGDMVGIVYSTEVPDGPVQLGIRADKSHYHFAFSIPHGDWQEIGKGEVRYLSTEVAGGFTGVYFGLYATSNGNPSRSTAYFDWFDYVPQHE